VRKPRGLARAGYPGKNHQFSFRNPDFNRLEIVLAGAANEDVIEFFGCGFHSVLVVGNGCVDKFWIYVYIYRLTGQINIDLDMSRV
jgi:hypothetical protein